MATARQVETGHTDENDPTKQRLLAESPSDSETPSSSTDSEELGAAPDGLGAVPDRSGAAPDGGWGWVVVFAVFMSSFLMDGSIGSFGIIYPELLRAFDSGPSLTSLAGSIIVGVFLMSCPVGGFLLRRFGCRLVCILGGCITAIGFVISSTANSILIFILSYGILGGFGIGMNLIAGHILVNMYFDKRRGLACGIVTSGAGLGVFVLALATQKLLDEYGWRGTMLISAGFMLQFCVFACFLRPLTPKASKGLDHSSTNNNSEDSKVTQLQRQGAQFKEDRTAKTAIEYVNDNKDNNIAQTSKENPSLVTIIQNEAAPSKPSAFQSLMNISSRIKGPNSHLVSLPDLSGSDTSAVNVRYKNFDLNREELTRRRHCEDPFLRKDIFYSGSLCHLKQYRESANIQTFIRSMTVIHSEDEASSDGSSTTPAPPTAPGFCDLSVFKNGVYIPILIGAVLLQMGQFIPSTFIPEYCVKIGLSGNDGSVIISIYGASNIVGRLSAGCLANVRCINSLWLCNFGAAMCAVCCALFPFCTTFPTLCVFAVGFGYFIGYPCPLQYIIIVDYLGLNKLTSAMGILQLFKGPAALAGPPLAGFVYEWTKDYAMSVGFAAVLFLLAAVVQSMVPFTNRCCAAQVDRMEIRVNV